VSQSTLTTITFGRKAEQQEMARKPTVRFMSRNGSMQTFGLKTVDVAIIKIAPFDYQRPSYISDTYPERFEMTVICVKDGLALQIPDL
jgi:hypothetical protein